MPRDSDEHLAGNATGQRLAHIGAQAATHLIGCVLEHLHVWRGRCQHFFLLNAAILLLDLLEAPHAAVHVPLLQNPVRGRKNRVSDGNQVRQQSHVGVAAITDSSA